MTPSESGERPDSTERPPTQAEPEPTPHEARRHERESSRPAPPQGMVPGRERRRTKLERGTMRRIATGGLIGIAVVLVGQDVAAGSSGW